MADKTRHEGTIGQGMIVRGTVTGSVSGGVLVNIEDDSEGIIPYKHLSTPSEQLEVGEEIWVYVIRIRASGRKLLSQRRAEKAIQDELREARKVPSTRRDEPAGAPPTRRDIADGIAPTRREEGNPPPTRQEGVSSVPQARSETIRSDGRSLGVLPSALVDRFEIVEAHPATGSEAEIYTVKARKDDRPFFITDQRYIVKVYREGVHPKPEVLDNIRQSNSSHVVNLYEYDISDGRTYELQEYAAYGSLQDLIEHGAPNMAPHQIREHARMILDQLADAISALHEQGIWHKDIKPANILIRSLQPFDLMLTDFGVAAAGLQDMSQHLTETAAHGTIAYAAPERFIGEGKGKGIKGIVAASSDYWSLGVILVEILTGEHPFKGLHVQTIITHLVMKAVPIDTSAIEDAQWRLLCRGLLVKDFKKRWGKEEIDRWLDDDDTLTVEEAPAETPSTYQPFPLAGEKYQTPRNLALGLAQHWDEGIKNLNRGYIEEWLKKHVQDYELNNRFDDINATANFDSNAKLFMLITSLNPELPPTYMGYSLTRQSRDPLVTTRERVPDGIFSDVFDIASLAEAAYSGTTSAREAVASLYETRVLQAYAEQTGKQEYRSLDDEWRQTVKQYRELLRRAALEMKLDPTSPQLKSALVDVLLLLSSREFAAKTRDDADKVLTEDARSCRWFKPIAQAFPQPAALLATKVLAPFAAEEVRSQRQQDLQEREQERKAREKEERRRRNELAEQRRIAYGQLNRLRLIGAGIGGAVGLYVALLFVMQNNESFFILLAMAFFLLGGLVGLGFGGGWGFIIGGIAGLFAGAYGTRALLIPVQLMIDWGFSGFLASLLNIIFYAAIGFGIGWLAFLITDGQMASDLPPESESVRTWSIVLLAVVTVVAYALLFPGLSSNSELANSNSSTPTRSTAPPRSASERSPQNSSLFSNASIRDGVVTLDAKTYSITEPVVLDQPLRIEGQGADASKVVFSGRGTLMIYKGSGTLRFEDVSLIRKTSNPGNVITAESGTIEVIRSRLSGGVGGSPYSGAGLILDARAQGIVSTSTIESNTVGIKLLGNSLMEVTNSIIQHNSGPGIALFGEATAVIKANTVYENGGDGILLKDASSARIVENTIQDNARRGISYLGGSSGTASDNQIYRNGYGHGNDYWQGIGIEDNSSPSLIANTIRESAGPGIQFLDSAGGVARDNRLIGNSVNYEVFKSSYVGCSEISAGGLVLGRPSFCGNQDSPKPTLGSNHYEGNIGGGLSDFR